MGWRGGRECAGAEGWDLVGVAPASCVRLLTSATSRVQDFLPDLRVLAAQSDLLVQRDNGPGASRLGCAVSAGFTYVRAAKREALLQFFADVVRRGLVEFYLRWANNVDQFGWSHIVAESAERPQTSEVRPAGGLNPRT